MEFFYNAYQAYERRVIRGEFSGRSPGAKPAGLASTEPFLARFGDFLISTGTRLKRHYLAEKPLTWTPVTRSSL